MALRSKRDNKDYNGNEVYVQVGQYKAFQNILSLTCWDDEGNEYSIKSLLEKILEQEAEIKGLKETLRKYKASMDNYKAAENQTDAALVKAIETLNTKISTLQIDVAEIQGKTKYL